MKMDEETRERFLRFSLIFGALIFAAGIFCEIAIHPGQTALFVLFFVSWLLIGGDVVFRALRGIGKGKIFDENFLMSLATI